MDDSGRLAALSLILLALLTLLLLPAAAAAQQDARPLSLAEALRIAEENSPAVHRARAQTESAEADVRVARAAYLPDLTVSMGTSGSLARVFTGLDEFGQPVRRDEPISSRFSASSQSLSLGAIPIFDGGRTRGQLRQAHASLDAAGAEADEALLSVRAEVAQRYHEAARARDRIALEERALERERVQVELTERLIRLARASPLDLRAAEVTVAEREAALVRARGEARLARLALRESMGVVDGPDFELAEAPPEVFDTDALEVDALVRMALERSPSLEALRAREAAAEHGVRIARAERWPQLSVSAGMSRGTNAPGFDALFDPNPLDQSLGFNFSLSVPLFRGFQVDRNIAAARAGRTLAAADAASARIAAEREIRSAVIELQNAEAVLRAAERSLELNRDRAEMAEESYRLGSVDFRDLNDALTALINAERAALEARYDFARARAVLEHGMAIDLAGAARGGAVPGAR